MSGQGNVLDFLVNHGSTVGIVVLARFSRGGTARVGKKKSLELCVKNRS